LRDAGKLVGHRSGRAVNHARTAVAGALLELHDE
jgi:hypothetical protein